MDDRKKWAPANLQEPEIELAKQLLERVAKRELHFTRRASGTGNCPEGCSGDTSSWISKAVVIEQIERFPTQLERVVF